MSSSEGSSEAESTSRETSPERSGSPTKMEKLLKEVKQMRAALKNMKPTPQESDNTPQGQNVPQGAQTAAKNTKNVKQHLSDNREPTAGPSSAIDEPANVAAEMNDYLGSDSNSDQDDNASDGEQEEDDWFQELAQQFQDKEATGPPLPDNLAPLVTNMVKNKMAIPAQNVLLADVKTPSNAPLLGNPRVNADVWANLSATTRQRDLRLSIVGEKISKSLIKTAELTAGLTNLRSQVSGETKSTIKELSKMALESFQFGSMALQEVNQRRRDSMRFDLQPAYKTLCNPPEEETETLFGEDVAEKMRTIQQMKSIGSKITKKNFLGQGRNKPYEGRNPRQESRNRPENQKPHWQPSYRSGKPARGGRHQRK